MQWFEKARQYAIAIALTGVSLSAAHATFPGENGDIIYSTWEEPKIQRMEANGVVKKLADGIYPAVSPSGKKIAYSSSDGLVPGSRLFLMNMDGSGKVDIGPGTMPSWSPD